MRTLLTAIATILSAGLMAATSAHAAARWTCDGPEYVCGGASSSSASDEGTPRRAAKARKQETSVTNDDDEKPARRKRAAVAKSSDDDAQPVRRKRAVVAKASDDDEKPARRRRARSSDDGDNGGGATFSGAASYYWEPQALASGGRFNPNAYTAAHKTLPFGTRVRVTNQRNGQSVDVVINDRGPYVAGRVIDLSKAAAHDINMQGAGVVPVSVRILGRG